MINPVFTENQMKIIHSDSYPVYLKAAAGSGKTEVLINKILHILKSDEEASLDNMVIITFTNRAVDEIQERLSLLLAQNCTVDKKLQNQMDLTYISNISTIHSFCEKLLREYGLSIGISPNFKVSSYFAKTANIISDEILKMSSDSLLANIEGNVLKNAIFEFYYRNDNCGIDGLVNSYLNSNDDIDKFKSDFIQFYNHICKIVETTKLEDNVLTSNDLIKKCSLLLKNNHIRKVVCTSYKYLLMDEYQDTNLPQFDIVKCLIDGGVKVFLVGDERQSIYGFRGADINSSQLMSRYIENLNSTKFTLSENFRSDAAVINTVNQLFSSNYSFNGKTLNFDKSPLIPYNKTIKPQDKVVHFNFGTSIVDEIKAILKDNPSLTYNQIAVLCRKNYMVDYVGEQLKEADVPVEVIGGRGFYKAKEIIDICKIFNYIVYRSKEYKGELIFTDVYKSFVINNGDNFDDFLDALLEISQLSSAQSVLEYIISNSNLEKFYINRCRYQAISNLYKLQSIIDGGYGLEFTHIIQFCDFLNKKITMEAEEDEAPISDENRKKGVVSVYTVHKAKGLSFPVVIISGMDNSLINLKQFPKIIMKSEDGKTVIGFSEKIIGRNDTQYAKLLSRHIIEMLEEELRVLYVACTRAKHMLVFLCKQSKDYIFSAPDSVSWAKWVIENLKC